MTWEKFWMSVLATVALAVITFAGTVLVLSVRSNGETDYCYMEWYNPAESAPMIRLTAHVPWRTDRRVAYFTNAEAAIEAAKQMKCPLERR